MSVIRYPQFLTKISNGKFPIRSLAIFPLIALSFWAYFWFIQSFSGIQVERTLRNAVEARAIAWVKDKNVQKSLLPIENIQNFQQENFKTLTQLGAMSGAVAMDIIDPNYAIIASSDEHSWKSVFSAYKNQINAEVKSGLSKSILTFTHEKTALSSHSNLIENPEQFSELHFAHIIIPIYIKREIRFFVQLHYDVSAEYHAYHNNIKNILTTIAILILVIVLTAFYVSYYVSQKRRQEWQVLQRMDNEARDQYSKRAAEMQTLSELSEWLQSAKSLNEYFTILKKFMLFYFPDREGLIYIYQSSGTQLQLRCAWNADESQIKNRLENSECWGIRRGRLFRYGDSSVDIACNHVHSDNVNRYLCLPIMAQGETLGLLHIAQKKNQPYTSLMQVEDQKLALLCVEQISMSLSNAKLREKLEEQTLRDPLTGVYNRRGFYKKFVEYAELTKNKNGFYLISFDLDHFKSFNDNYGHDVGDLVLVSVAQTVQSFAKDSLFRLGGEEFAFFTIADESENPVDFVNIIRKKIESIKLKSGNLDLPTVTASFGLSAFPHDDLTPDGLLRAADQALYEAKANGRNQVVNTPGAEASLQKLNAPKSSKSD